MPRKLDVPRLSDIIMDELADGQPWDLEKHLTGCLAGYQTNPSYGTAVYFALEALSGIAHDVAVRASADVFDPSQRDADWIISPNAKLPVPWMWIRALGAAWDRYKADREPLGVAFGLEGGGQGKSPTINKLAQMLDERAIARWIGSQLAAAREAKRKIRIEDLVQQAAEKFQKSDVTIRRAWQWFRREERQLNPK
jgi:hypothetical protein